jgi:hypothetical protein
MSALLLMPTIVKLIVSGKSLQILVHTCLMIIQMAILEGEMWPIMWIPTIVLAGVAATIPASVPPDVPNYVTKRREQELSDSWRGYLTGRIRGIADRIFDRVGAVSRLSHLGASDNKPRTNTYIAAQRRRCGVTMSRRLARSLKLVSITCLAASAFEGATAFDSDSKQVAIDNCSSRSLTTSRKDFVPCTIR